MLKLKIGNLLGKMMSNHLRLSHDIFCIPKFAEVFLW